MFEMISLQKAMRLGIAPQTEIESDKVQKIHIREDCSPETISDILRLYGDVEISEPLPNNDFDKIIQKISLAIWNSKISVKLWGIFRNQN